MQKIMFNDKYGLTKAVLEGRKTQTRRIIDIDEEELNLFQTIYYNQVFDFLEGKDLIEAYFDNNPKKIPYKKGDIVAVAQSYKDCGGFMEDGTPRWDYISCIVGNKNAGWSNKMFVKPELMPHQIRMKNVRIERLQDISDEDCLAEGIEFDAKAKSFYCGMNVLNNSKIWLGCTPREAYATLVDKVSKKGDWNKNPYVFAYEFELIK